MQGFTGTYFQVGQRMFSYTETTGYSNEPLATIPGEYDYIFIDGFGTEEDFAALNGALKENSLLLPRFYLLSTKRRKPL